MLELRRLVPASPPHLSLWPKSLTPRLAFFNNLTPLFAAVLSAAVLGEAPQAYHALAFALIVGGISVSLSRPLYKLPG